MPECSPLDVTRTDLAIVLCSALLHASWNALAKRSREPIAFSLLMSVANVVAGVAIVPFTDFHDLSPAVWRLVGATGLVHALYFLWLGMAYQRGDLSVVYPISRSAPAFVTLAAVPLLGEVPSIAGALGIAVVVVGMWLVQTDGVVRRAAFTAPGTFHAYLTLAATVAYSLLDKRAMALLSATPWHGAAPRAVVFYVLLCAATAPLFWPMGLRLLRPGALRLVAREEGRWILGATVVGFVSYALILQAMRTAPVSYIVAVRQTSVLFAVVLGTAWLRERPGRLRLLGAAATVAGVALIALRP
jgi:drug/metabolite transporter (DMT)-like permease